MEWKDWIGKRCYIKLKEFYVFTNSKVLAFEEPFLSITDRDGFPVVINVSQIEIIREDLKKIREEKNGSND